MSSLDLANTNKIFTSFSVVGMEWKWKRGMNSCPVVRFVKTVQFVFQLTNKKRGAHAQWSFHLRTYVTPTK